MKKIKSLFIMLMLLVLSFPTYAQQYISYSEYPEGDGFADLDGDRGMLIFSRFNDLVLMMTNVKKSGQQPVIHYNGKGMDGMYSYEVIIDVNDTPLPNIAVSRRGSVYKTNIIPKKNLKENYFIAYKVDEVDKPIRYDEQTSSTSVVLDEEKAAVELTSPMKDLRIEVDSELMATISKEPNKADPNIMIYNIEIPIKNYLRIAALIDTLTAKCNEYNKLVDKAFDEGIKVSEEKEKEGNMYIKQLEETKYLWSKVNNIRVYGQGTNSVLLNIEKMAPRVKRCYAILPLVVEKEVFVTECSRFMSEGAKLFSLRKYKEAKAAYTSALNASDLVKDMKPAIEESITLCDTCEMCDKVAGGSIMKILTMKKDGTATQSEVVKYATAALDFLERLNKYNECEFYQSRINTMKKLIDSLPLKIKFTIVEWKTLNEGDYIPGVEVWTFKGNYALTINSFSTDRKFKRMVDGEKDAYQQVGISDENGNVEIELDRKNLPKGVIFRPNKDEDIKIKYLPFTDLIRQAHGTYIEKQFRLKMFVKD